MELIALSLGGTAAVLLGRLCIMVCDRIFGRGRIR